MKRSILLLTALIGFGLGSASVEAALSYWDGNGTTNGAGDTPNGIWDPDPLDPLVQYYWSADPTGASATNAWKDGDTAVFSAGTDATNAFTVTVNGTLFGGAPSAGGLTFEEGEVTLSGGGIMMTNEFEFPIITMTNAIITLPMQDVTGTCGIKKTGPGTLTLKNVNYFGGAGGTNTVVEGVLAAAAAGALGNPVWTVVSNGATLQAATSQNLGNQVILHGNGVANSGALHGTSGSPQWQGGAQLYADARINWDGGGQWNWISPAFNIEGIAGGSNFNLTIGGNGGTMRLNMANPYNRAVNLGTGKLIKEGTCTLQFENGTICSGFYLNGGGVYPRNITTIGSPGASIYVGTNRCGFFALFQDCTITTPISLAAGADLWFEPRVYNGNTLNFTCNSLISGLGGVSVTNAGHTIFTAANTYTGATTIQSNSASGGAPGILILGANGSIAYSAVIDVQTGATFDVSAVNGGFVLGAAQMLKGDGAVVGNVTANGTLSPGGSIGNLTFNNDLTLAAGASLAIEVDKSASPANDAITVVGALSSAGTGTVTVTNLGPALVTGDSFQLFGQPLPNGQGLTVASADGSVVWTNKLAEDGSIAVVKVVPPQPPPTNLTVSALSPASFKLRARGGPNQAYSVYAYTNVAAPVANWWLLGTVFADAGGVVQFVDPQATNRQRFYRLSTVTVAPARVAATNLTIAGAGPAAFQLRGLGGPNLTYGLYAATNVTPPASWVLIGNTVADAGGVIQFVDPQATTRQRFYRFGQ